VQKGEYWSVGLRKNYHDVTTHNLLCLVDSYHLIAQADILANNRHHEARYCP